MSNSMFVPQSQTHSLANVFFVSLITSKIEVIELALSNQKYFYVKNVHIGCVFSLSLTRSVSHRYKFLHIFAENLGL